jgi:transcriptional regulator with XRE-family HTH domain
MANLRDPVCVQVGLNIRRLRSVAGLSRAELGGRLGVTFQQVHHYESGRTQIGVAMFYRVTQILNCEVAALFIGLGGEEIENRLDAEEHKATFRTSRVVQSIGDRRVRECFIELGRELGKAERLKK